MLFFFFFLHPFIVTCNIVACPLHPTPPVNLYGCSSLSTLPLDVNEQAHVAPPRHQNNLLSLSAVPFLRYSSPSVVLNSGDKWPSQVQWVAFHRFASLHIVCGVGGARTLL